VAPPSAPVVGHPRARLRVSADAPAASLSVKLCDVFPDGTSALVARGTLDLAFRDGVHGNPAPLEPGREYDVLVDLDACAYAFAPGQRLRVSVAGADWPNTVAPPAPVGLTVHAGTVELPLLHGEQPESSFAPGADRSAESNDGVTWEITSDVLARTTTARTRSCTTYPTPYDGHALEDYRGEVSVDRRSFAQRAHADTRFELHWPDVDVALRSVMDVAVTGDGIEVAIDLWAHRDGGQVAHRTWRERVPPRC
jgi:uncharacterized protein